MRRFMNCLRLYNTKFNQTGVPFCDSVFRNEKPRLNLTSVKSRNFHFSGRNHEKIYPDIENTYVYKFLPQLVKIKPEWTPHNRITSMEDFDQFLDKNWRTSTATSIVEAFETVRDFVISHNINLSDERFDKLVDGLMDHCEKLTDQELLKLLLIILEYPPCQSANSHNFHDVWSCLDDVCCWKLGNWDIETMFSFADVWYRLNLGRLSDYIYELLDKASVKSHRLSKSMLLYTCFFINVSRRKTVTFEFEQALVKKIDLFSPDELAIIAMGYFKGRTKIKLKPTLSAMIRAISDNHETINEISLTAMLKAIRLSQHPETTNEIIAMLDKLTDQIPRLSHMSLIHMALMGTSLQINHEASLIKCTERLIKDVENVRLKDIERMLLACSMFNVDTEPSFFEKSFHELHKDTRREEFVKYSRCLPCALNYLSLRQYYSPELLNHVLDEDFINETYGKSSRNLPRELFSLDSCIEVECPTYSGNRLSPAKKYKAAKWLTEFTPSHDQPKRQTLADKFYLDVLDHVIRVVGDEKFVRSDHVLPHFSKSDIILCRDKSGAFVEPFGFENYVLGDVKRPFDGEKYKWIAVVVMTPNLTVRNQSRPLGSMIMKERQLKISGYEPIFVYWNQFVNLAPPEKTAWIARQFLTLVDLSENMTKQV